MTGFQNFKGMMLAHTSVKAVLSVSWWMGMTGAKGKKGRTWATRAGCGCWGEMQGPLRLLNRTLREVVTGSA